MEEDVPEREIATDIKSDSKCDNQKNKANGPEEDHKSGFSLNIIKDKDNQLIIRYFKNLPVPRDIFKIFNPRCHKRKLSPKLAFWGS
jgi:hypothetical protein